jgi:vacuolar-type H+-ATPase subunit E/Vma4
MSKQGTSSMESIEKGKAALISTIEADARTEEERIIKEAGIQAEEKRQYARKKAESILNDAREQASKEAEAARRKIFSDVELEIKRNSLRIRDEVIRDIIDRVGKKLDSMIGTPDYRSVLLNWIAEAAIGLDVESARVNASEKERMLINEQLLSQVKEKISSQTGKVMTLTLSDSPPLQYQGIVLTAEDGRVAFNNQVKTRLSRNNRKIQALIYNALFSGNPNV